jgi:hypothetical protein
VGGITVKPWGTEEVTTTSRLTNSLPILFHVSQSYNLREFARDCDVTLGRSQGLYKARLLQGEGGGREVPIPAVVVGWSSSSGHGNWARVKLPHQIAQLSFLPPFQGNKLSTLVVFWHSSNCESSVVCSRHNMAHLVAGYLINKTKHC